MQAMNRLLDLWHGRLPLKSALWSWALLWGTLANVAALLAALALATGDTPGALVAAVFVLPLPYVLVAAVGVWRSAGRPGIAAREAAAARLTVVVWALAMLVL